MSHLLGIGLILISAASFGAMAIFAKFAYLSGISPHSLLFYRFVIAVMVMLPIAVLQKRRFPKGKDLYTLIAMGAIGYAGQSYCYFTALTLISPSLVAILLYLYPVFVAVLSVFFLNETLTKNKLFALCSAISGTILVIGLETNGNMKGVMLGIGAAVIYSVYTIAGARVMSRNDAFTSSLVVITSAACFYLFYNIKAGFFFPTACLCWMNIMAIAILSTVVAIYTYFQGMKLSGAVNASMLSTFEPVTTMVLAALFLGQHIGWLQMIGTALILSSAVLVAIHSKSD
ncbi:MAG: DMT family transporter [Desulfobacula sp.]|uniref:DMT family transporter n=1 Tax=Desulfobacula sp. TaxID=2593537 RepID=UPI0025B82212|nr:DMT family transporter [Desulfobacula sp.]MCD4722250.1 DMT family transporter [Desulfobacula sp.]